MGIVNDYTHILPTGSNKHNPSCNYDYFNAFGMTSRL